MCKSKVKGKCVLVYTLKILHTLLLSNGADWITSEILYIIWINKFILVNNEVSDYFI